MSLGDWLAEQQRSDRPAEYHEVGVVTQASPLLVAVGADSVGQPVSAHSVGANVGDRVLVLVQGAARTALANLTQLPSWHSVGAVGEPAFQNGWSNYGGGFVGAAYRREGTLVVVRGLIQGGTLLTTAFNLPAGFRPIGGALLWIINTNTGPGRLDVHTDGNVNLTGGGNGWASINCVFSAI